MSDSERNSKDENFSQICGDSFSKSLNRSKESFNGMPQYPEIDMIKRHFINGTPVKKTEPSGMGTSSASNNNKK